MLTINSDGNPSVEIIRFEFDVEKGAEAVIDSPLPDYLC